MMVLPPSDPLPSAAETSPSHTTDHRTIAFPSSSTPSFASASALLPSPPYYAVASPSSHPSSSLPSTDASRQQPFPLHHHPIRRYSSLSKGKGRAGPGRSSQPSRLLAEGVAGGLWEENKRATGTGPVSEGYPDCSSQDNSVLTCYPNSTTAVAQDEWSKLIWNFNYPLFIANNNTVDVYLYRANDDTLIQRWDSLPNPEGQLAFSPTETWWDKFGASSTLEEGETLEWQAYFIIKPGGSSVTGDEVHQSTFVGVQTALPTASSASLASLSAQSTASVASTASLAMASIISVGTGTAYSSIVSASRASESARSTASVGEASMLSTASVGSTSALSASASASRRAAANGSLQGNGNGAGLPKWAIALVSVLGALLLLAALVLAYILIRRAQRRRGVPTSVGSSTPMMQSRDGQPGSNLAAGLGAGAAAGGALAGAAAGRSKSHSSDDYDSNSPHSPTSNNLHSNIPYGHHSSSPNPNTSINAPSLSGQDAASISAAYRAALSEPNFDEPSPEDGNTPDETEGVGRGGGDEVLRRELERQGVKVQGVKGGMGRSVNDWSQGRFGRQ